MELQVWQIIVITVLAFLKGFDFNTTQLACFNSLIWGTLTGLVLGDLQTGLFIGGTIQLMSMGVVAIGGSSAADYPVAAIIAVAIAISTGQGTEAGLALGIPVGLLGVQMDIIAKIINGFFAKKSQDYANAKQFERVSRITLLSPILFGLVTAIPVFLSITLGKAVIELILNHVPEWFTLGLSIAGGILPAVGIAMLLTYMPAKRFFSYLLGGYVLSAYMKLPILGVAMIGFALAFEFYHRKLNEGTVLATNGMMEDE